MLNTFPIAIAQCLISSDVRENGKVARQIVRSAAQRGARLVHFPEAALSGYVKSQIKYWSTVDWVALTEEQDRLAALAGEVGVWIVIGSNTKLPEPCWPHNSLLVISDQGRISFRYDKRYCSHTEASSWYTPGTDPVIFMVDGVKFGCALCIEVCFPELFSEYERQGVDCVLLSSYSEDAMHGIMARAHAATNCYWISMAIPVQCSQGLKTALIGPDGNIVATCRAGRSGLLNTFIDPAASQFAVALNHARPWRAKARLPHTGNPSQPAPK